MLAEAHDFDIDCHAGEPVTIIAVVALVISLAMAVYTMMTMPKQKKGEQGSSNNNLANSQNSQNIGGRIDDILGTVKAKPRLVAPSINIYENNKQVEEQLMVLSRGYCHVDEAYIWDGDTPFVSIEGGSLSIYPPDTDIVTGTPQLQIGENFDYAPYIAKPSKSVSDQLLAVPNELAISSSDLYFEYPNFIKSKLGAVPAGLQAADQILMRGAEFGVNDQPIAGPTNILPTGIIEVTSAWAIDSFSTLDRLKIDSLLIQNEDMLVSLAGSYRVVPISSNGLIFRIRLVNPASVNPDWQMITDDATTNLTGTLSDSNTKMDLNGKYSVAAVSNTVIELNVPSGKAVEWAKLNAIFSGSSVSATADLSIDKLNDQWVGWIEYKDENITELWLNFKAPNGLWYQDSKGGVWPREVICKVEYQRVEKNEPTGPVFESLTTLKSAKGNKRDSVGLTKKIDLGFKGSFRFRVCRLTEDDLSSKVADDVNITDAYAVYQIDKTVYDDVTLIRTRVVADKTALSIKDRQLSMIASRMFYTWISGKRSAERVITSNFADIVCNITEDKYIGRRSVDHLDIAHLYKTSADMATYFGTSKVNEFNYTLDRLDQSYEETLKQISTVVFCNARRASGETFFEFEQLNPSSSILFNHRNKKPLSETRTMRGGDQNKYDGVEVKWVDPDDNWADATLKVPHEGITNPKKVELAGVTNKIQAHFLAWRIWNRIKYAKETVQFTAYGEGDLVTVGDRISVADDVSPSLVPMGSNLSFTSGQIVEWVNTRIIASQPIDLLPNVSYTIHLQLPNGSVETMGVRQGNSEQELILERLPILPLITQYDDRTTPTVYSITTGDDKESEAFLITEKSAGSTFESSITAQNYDQRYYDNDKDHINNLI